MKPLNQIRNINKRMLYCAQALSRFRLFATTWTVACQAPLSLGILQAGILEWLPCPPPGDLPNPGIKLRSAALQADSLPADPYRRIFFYKNNSLFVLCFWYYLLYQCFQYKMVLLPMLLINRNSLLSGFMCLINGILTYLHAKLTTLKMGTNMKIQRYQPCSALTSVNILPTFPESFSVHFKK